MKILFTQQISEHPSNVGVSRYVDVMLPVIDGFAEKMDIVFQIRHVMGGSTTPFITRLTEVIDNSRTMWKRDGNFEPIPNPDYDEELGNEPYLSEPAFNLITDVIFNSGVPLSSIIGNYILEMDSDGKFN